MHAVMTELKQAIQRAVAENRICATRRTDEEAADHIFQAVLNTISKAAEFNEVYCPGCGASIAPSNNGCPDCGYENNEDGRLLSLGEMLRRPSYPATGALRLNDVGPSFLLAVIASAMRATSR